MQVKRLLILPLLAALGGCETTGTGSVKGSCRAFEAPQYAVRGATQHDQDWIDPTIESGIGACNWTRPAPRPAAWDAKPSPPPIHKAAKKRTFAARVKEKIWPEAAEPVLVVPEAPVTPILSAPVPRSAIDELLHPSDTK